MKKLIILLGAILIIGQSCVEEKNEVKPNIIMFLVDDMGWQDCSEPFWKEKTDFNERYATPNIERLATQGMKFTQAYACAICSPTRVSLMSGMNAARHRVTNWTLRRGKSSVREPETLQMPEWNLNGAQPTDSIERSVHITSLPQILKDNGYTTIHCGKAHFGAIIAIDSILKSNKPFYLYMAHYAIHTPIQADNRYIDKYNQKIDDKIEARYASMIEGMDKSLGDLMDFLEEKGIADNTIILFMSDNGGLSAVARGGKPHTHNKPLSSGKGSAHEGGIREPMIVKWPGLAKPASVNNDYLIIEDFFPTILEMANIQEYNTVQQIDGISFVKKIKGEEPTTKDRALFWHYPNNWGPTGPGIGASSTVRSGDWKLIYYHTDRSFELFNIKQDIGETVNLADKNHQKLKELAKTLSEYLRNVNAQMPIDKRTGNVVEWPDEVL